MALPQITVHRVYELPVPEGFRVLIDRLWPRGVKRDSLELDAWRKDLAPSPGLRKWFAHDPGKWTDFRNRYLQELSASRQDLLQLRLQAGNQRLVLLYAARDERHNHARVLQEALEGLPSITP